MDKTSEPTVSLSLTVKDATKALTFYTQALEAEELFRMTAPDGRVVHAEFTIGNTRIYISGEAADWHAFAMAEGATASCLFTVVTANCDEAYERAVGAGAESLSAPRDQFWGMRSAMIKDPFGYRWAFGQKLEKASPEALQEKAAKLISK
jgi:PhnB protein